MKGTLFFCDFYDRMKMQEIQRQLTGRQAERIEKVCQEVAKALAELVASPSARGEQIVIHVSRDGNEFSIELPPKRVRITD